MSLPLAVLPPEAPRRAALFGLLAFVGLSWGGAITATKVATSTGHHPFGLIFWQLSVAVLLLGAIQVLRGGWPRLDRASLGFFAGVAVIGTLAPNFASISATAKLPAGVVATVMAVAPMTSLALAAAMGIERPGPWRIFGIVLGAVAVAMIAAPEAALPDPSAAPFVLVAVLAALCYGVESIYVKLRQPGDIDPLEALLGASVLGLAALVPVVALVPGVWVAMPGVWGPAERAVLVNGVLHVGAYWGYLRLIGQGGPVFAATVSYAVTAGAILWGMTLLGERHSLWIWGALAVMVAGMSLVQPRR